MPELYAQALARLLESGMAPKEAVRSLKALLERRGQVTLFPRIARAFTNLAARERRRTEVRLIVARSSDEKAAREESGASDATLSIDESLIGGWRLEGRGRLVDASWKKALLALYTRIV